MRPEARDESSAQSELLGVHYNMDGFKVNRYGLKATTTLKKKCKEFKQKMWLHDKLNYLYLDIILLSLRYYY